MELAAPGARGRPEHFDRRVVASSAAAVVGLAFAAGAAVISASGGVSDLAIVARVVIVGVPTGVGLRTVVRHDNTRFGWLLIGVGAALLVSTLAETDDELVYTIGRSAGWVVQVLLIALILTFPTGHLTGSVERALLGATVLVVLTLFVPRLLLAEHFELPSPYTSCTHHCPTNAFFALDDQPGFVNGFMRPAGALMMVAVTWAVVLRLRERIRDASRLARRMFIPVLGVGIGLLCILCLGFVLRQADPGAWPVRVLAWTLALSAPALALAFLGATLRWQLDAGRALERLAGWARDASDPVTLRLALAEAFDDPALQIALPEDAAGRRSSDCDSGRVVSEVREDGALVAAVVHDEALRASPRLLDAGLAMAGIVLANQRLVAEAETATEEVRRSRARISASAEHERRRIERDLHDGAQQRLVALRIELELTEDLVRRDPGRGIGRLQELELEVDEALEELRTLAHGVYPPLLADRGLEEAIRTVGARCAVPLDVDAREIGRYAPEIESAVYFCFLEALQNVLKHAKGARHVFVRLDGTNPAELRFSVRDDGAGGDDSGIEPGAGLTNMRDRMAAVDGDVSIASLRAVGTTVRGRVPVGFPERA
jgi:signal transduction histidine kinase